MSCVHGSVWVWGKKKQGKRKQREDCIVFSFVTVTIALFENILYHVELEFSILICC